MVILYFIWQIYYRFSILITHTTALVLGSKKLSRSHNCNADNLQHKLRSVFHSWSSFRLLCSRRRPCVWTGTHMCQKDCLLFQKYLSTGCHNKLHSLVALKNVFFVPFWRLQSPRQSRGTSMACFWLVDQRWGGRKRACELCGSLLMRAPSLSHPHALIWI